MTINHHLSMIRKLLMIELMTQKETGKTKILSNRLLMKKGNFVIECQ